MKKITKALRPNIAAVLCSLSILAALLLPLITYAKEFLPAVYSLLLNDSEFDCNPCNIFVTEGETNGDLNGPQGADAMCMSDANYPGTGTYKAMIVDTVNRIACTSPNCAIAGADEHVDWVLHPDTAYQRVDGTEIGQTNGVGLFIFDLTNAIDPSGTFPHGGFNSTDNWTTGTLNNCSNWTDSSAVGSTRVMVPSDDRDNFLSGGGFGCNINGEIMCVQQ